jgi:alpha-glucoside transport system substrate-binding protein
VATAPPHRKGGVHGGIEQDETDIEGDSKEGEAHDMTGFSIARPWRAAALALGALLLIAACTPTPPSGGGGGGGGKTITLWTAWGGEELKTFQNVLKPFKDKTGIDTRITTIRDINQLAVNVEAGTTMPDIAYPPAPDKIPDWARKGVMKPLESFLDMAAYTKDTYPALLNVNVVDGKHYQLFVKTQVKGLFWYNTKTFTGTPPATFDDLLKVPVSGNQKRFCVGLESGEASGWPATDMMENIVMRQSGADVYTRWIAGTQKWTSPEIKLGFQTLGQMVNAENAFGGPNTVLSTAFQRAGKPLFANPPGCLFLEQATFITNFFKEDYPNIKGVDDYNFFPHPAITPAHSGNVEGFADSFVMYNDTEPARELMKYLATADAQKIFVAAGGTLAANKTVTNFPDPLFKRANDMLTAAKNILLDADDNMPSDMTKAFRRGLLDFTRDQTKLDSILASLDQVQASSYKK